MYFCRSFIVVVICLQAAASAGAQVTRSLPVEKPQLTIVPADRGNGGWDLQLRVSEAVAVETYDIEISFKDPADWNWKFPGLLSAEMRAGNDAVLHIDPASLAGYSSTSD